MNAVKEHILHLANEMTDDETWDDVMYKIHVIQKIERSIKSCDEGRVISHEDMKKEFLGK